MHFNSDLRSRSWSQGGSSIGTPSIAGCWNICRCCWRAVEQQMSLWSMIFFRQKKAPEIRNYDSSAGFLFSRSKVVLASLDGSLQSCHNSFCVKSLHKTPVLVHHCPQGPIKKQQRFQHPGFVGWWLRVIHVDDLRPTNSGKLPIWEAQKETSLENTSMIQDHFWTSRYTI